MGGEGRLCKFNNNRRVLQQSPSFQFAYETFNCRRWPVAFVVIQSRVESHRGFSWQKKFENRAIRIFFDQSTKIHDEICWLYGLYLDISPGFFFIPRHNHLTRTQSTLNYQLASEEERTRRKIYVNNKVTNQVECILLLIWKRHQRHSVDGRDPIFRYFRSS